MDQPYALKLTAGTCQDLYNKSTKALPSAQAPPPPRYLNEMRRWQAMPQILGAVVVELMALKGWSVCQIYEAATGQFLVIDFGRFAKTDRMSHCA